MALRGSLASGDTVATGYNLYLRRPAHMQFVGSVPLNIAIEAMEGVARHQDPVLVRTTHEVLGSDVGQALEMIGEDE